MSDKCQPPTWVEDPADHAGEHHEEHWQQFQVATHDAAGLHVGQTTSCKAPLDYNLLQDKTAWFILWEVFILYIFIVLYKEQGEEI